MHLLYVYILRLSPLIQHEHINESVDLHAIVDRKISNTPLTQMLQHICICGSLMNAFWKGGLLFRDDSQLYESTPRHCEYVDTSKGITRADQTASTRDGNWRPRLGVGGTGPFYQPSQKVSNESSGLFHVERFVEL